MRTLTLAKPVAKRHKRPINQKSELELIDCVGMLQLKGSKSLATKKSRFLFETPAVYP
ncbi:hypothetical protein N779_03975 [Vibrio coralliilyticus OCN008]|nr:hypothetical protein N779_03975 [Vibrio coralliilyticus OCN008]